jgi:pimeloyl-ACP methyl ester carboxylesterase
MGARSAALIVALGVTVPGFGLGQQPPVADRFFESDGVRIRYVVRGSGPPLVLVHGFAVTPEMNWGASVDSFAPQFTVIAIELRGHGRSGKPHDPGAYGAQFTTDLAHLLDHLGIRRARVAGYSMGARIVLHFVTSHPDRVVSAVLGGGGWVPPGAPPPPFLVDWMAGLERAARGETTVADVIRRPDWPALSPGVIAMLNSNDPRALAAVLRGGAGLAVTAEALRANRVPVLAVVGAEDQPARGDVERLAGLLGSAEVSIVPDANHVTLVGDPRLAQAMLRFFRAH